MKYICDKCKKEFEYSGKEYGGYCVNENKDLCPKHWEEFTEIRVRHYRELKGWWDR